MYKIYKGLTAGYVIACVLGGIFLLFADLMGIGIVSGIVITIAWILVCALLYVIIVSLNDNKKVQYIHNCTPSKFILHGERVYPIITDVNYKNQYSLNLFTAYHDLGQREKAIDYLTKVNTAFPNNLSGKLIEIVYHINMGTSYQDVGNFDCAERELKEAEEVLKSDKLSKVTKENLFIICQANRYSLNISKGIYEGAEAFFSNRFNVEKTLRDKVIAKLSLAEIYNHNGDIVNTVEACNYVISNAGETRFVSEAKSILDNISK